jgi:hypothetical protein
MQDDTSLAGNVIAVPAPAWNTCRTGALQHVGQYMLQQSIGA